MFGLRRKHIFSAPDNVCSEYHRYFSADEIRLCRVGNEVGSDFLILKAPQKFDEFKNISLLLCQRYSVQHTGNPSRRWTGAIDKMAQEKKHSSVKQVISDLSDLYDKNFLFNLTSLLRLKCCMFCFTHHGKRACSNYDLAPCFLFAVWKKERKYDMRFPEFIKKSDGILFSAFYSICQWTNDSGDLVLY